MSGLEQPAGRDKRRWALLAGIGVVTAVIAGAAFRTWGPDNPTPARSTPQGPGPIASGVQVLPQPARVDSGIPVGYPHTTVGAVAAAVYYNEARDLITPDLVASQIGVMAVANPQQRLLLTQRGTTDATALRPSLGLSQDGGSDQNDHVTVQARAFHLDQQTTDHVEVWLLTWRTTVTNGATQEHAAYTVPVALTWDSGDWKLDDRTLPAAPAAADPDTAEAAADGWTSVA